MLDFYCNLTEAVLYSCFFVLSQMIAPPFLLYIAIKYRNKHNQQVEKNKKTGRQQNQFLFYVGITFYLVSIGLYACESVYIASICFITSSSIKGPIICCVAFLYASHWGAIILLLFTRLYFVFLNTARAISKCMIYLFFTICLFGLIVLVLFTIAHIKHWYEWLYWTRILSALCLLLISIWLIWAFVYRLFLTAKDSHSYSDNKELSKTLRHLMVTMTRYTVLSVISLSSTLALFLGLFFIGDESTGAMQIVWNLLVLVDITTNVICNTLFYAFATPVYKRLCGCLNERFNDKYRALLEREKSDETQIEMDDTESPIDINGDTPTISQKTLQLQRDITKLKLPRPRTISKQISSEDEIRGIDRRATIIAE